MPGVDGIKSFRALLKAALRHYGLRAIDAREISARNEDERARSSSLHSPPTHHGDTTMSAFSERIRNQKTGFFRVSDFEGGERTLTVAHLDEELEVFGETKDVLNFQETGQQLQLNQTNSEWLLDHLGDDPETWPGKKVILYLAPYEYKGEMKQGIRLRLPDAPAPHLVASRPGAASSVLGDGQTRARPERKDDIDDQIPF